MKEREREREKKKKGGKEAAGVLCDHQWILAGSHLHPSPQPQKPFHLDIFSWLQEAGIFRKTKCRCGLFVLSSFYLQTFSFFFVCLSAEVPSCHIISVGRTERFWV